jgi:hypothetical protein
MSESSHAIQDLAMQAGEHQVARGGSQKTGMIR